ncbi:MAG: UvrD-helicase domain-containing protein, partial [Bacteroidales bacterium]|nr:UvrD-helicase domain-containing protein [Bacteroidales bacterium]
MAQLKIFSASAGSGTTYTLARQVIDLLVADPRSYAHVLAVTFTNKATGEMKERIVGDLDLMANGADGDPAREELLSVHVGMCRSRGDEEATRAKVVGRAKTALMNILLDYGQFSVSTIDRFVQRVIRSFAYEQGLPSNYGLQLDTEPVID